jgi:hypothetical protein
MLLITAVLGSLAVSGAVNAGPSSVTAASPAPSSSVTTVYGNAPIGHLQPHRGQFSPASPAEQAQQQRMSKFDARQQMLNDELDKQLNICRC